MKLSDSNSHPKNLASTPLSSKIKLLSEIGLDAINDNNDNNEFFKWHALMFYMAIALDTKLVPSLTAEGERFIDMTWQAILDKLQITDTGFDSTSDLFGEEGTGVIFNDNAI